MVLRPPSSQVRNQNLVIQLRWKDVWPEATRDLDLRLYNFWGVQLNKAPMGQHLQTGGPADIPYEFIFLKDMRPGRYCIIIRDADAAQGSNPGPGPELQLQVYQDVRFTDLQFHSGSVGILNPAESRNPGLLAVGAAFYDDPHTIEDRSSRGPTLDGRIKPDLVGVDGVDSTAYGDPFWGTSQAAPHVAGLAALVRQRFPQYKPVQVTAYLKVRAVPRVESPPNHKVPNNIWGYGLAYLLPPPAPAVVGLTPAPHLAVTPVISLPPPPHLGAQLPGPPPQTMRTSLQRWMRQLERLQDWLGGNVQSPSGEASQDRAQGHNTEGGASLLLEPTQTPEGATSILQAATPRFFYPPSTAGTEVTPTPPGDDAPAARSASPSALPQSPLPLAASAYGSCSAADNLDTVYPLWAGEAPAARIETQDRDRFQAWQNACSAAAAQGWQRLEREPEMLLRADSVQRLCLISQGCEKARPAAHIADLHLISFTLGAVAKDSDWACQTDAQGVETCVEEVTYSGRCSEHRRVQPADYGSLELELSAQSRTWIATELRRRYPGAGALRRLLLGGLGA